MAGDTATLRERTAEEIRALLARRRMSATALARELRVSQTYIWRRLSGETAFDLDDLELIAKVLSVQAHDLLPRDVEGRTVVTSGNVDQLPTLRNSKPVRTGRVSHPKNPTPDVSTRRPGRIPVAAAA
jgi:hypothetical protein